MQERRSFLKIVTTVLAAAVVAPFRELFGAEKSATALGAPVSASDQNVIRAFYAEGWSRGGRHVFESHPAIVAQCSKLFERFRGAFPDLKIDVQSIQRNGEQIVVNWTAQGTHKGTLDGIAPTGRRAHAAGLTRMKIVDGKIVSTAAEWNETALKNQLLARKLG